MSKHVTMKLVGPDGLRRWRPVDVPREAAVEGRVFEWFGQRWRVSFVDGGSGVAELDERNRSIRYV